MNKCLTVFFVMVSAVIKRQSVTVTKSVHLDT